jgi:hypothetical protein
MAIYEVRDIDSSDEWLEDNSNRRFSTRPPADALYDHEVSIGRAVRLVRWDDYKLIHISPPRNGG